MEGQPRLIVAKSEWRVAAQNVDAVPARSEGLAELARDDAAAPDRGVAHDADVHGTAFNRFARTIGSRTITPSAHITPARAPNCASRLSMSCLNTGVLRRVGAASGF